MNALKNQDLARARKFGAFSGVFTPSILAILGVIMFLRLPWIVGQAGLWSTLGIILVAHIISISTGLSVASIATDKRVETGGSYFILSRTLGLPIGGTLGIALFAGLSFSVSLYLLGFSETILTYFGMEITLNNIRLVGSLVLLLITILAFTSTALAIKVQYFILLAIVLSLVSVFFGSHEHVPAEPLLRPYGQVLPWITLFAIFFPAVTGFQAGVAMSGDLKDPRKNIPLGTMMAILVGLVIYTGLAVFFAYTMEREMLLFDPQVLFNTSLVPQLVILGILFATLSSALVSILGAPRILQAVAIDRILPGFFSRGYGPSNEPRNALIFTFFIALSGVLIGELNVIARIVTIFFIIIYGFLNITYAIESWAGSDFRPSFRIPRFVSIIGALASIVVMIQLDIIALLVASLALILLFLFLKRRELTLQTGDTWNSIWASLVKTGLKKLTFSVNKPRNWRPNVILFSGGEKTRPHLVEMGKSLVGRQGIFTNFELVENPSGDIMLGKKDFRPPQKGKEKDGLLVRKHTCRDIYEGMDIITRVYGFTGFEPNTVLMGWGRNSREPEKFARLLTNLKKQDYNCAFLNYDKTAGFGDHRLIDFWWNGRGRSLSLALTLLRFVVSSDFWSGCRLRVLVISYDSSKNDTFYGLINQMLENYRLTAMVKVINNGVEQLPEEQIIHSESRQTDLTVLPLPEFGPKDAKGAVEKANQLSANLRTTLFISASSFFEEVNVLKPKEKPLVKEAEIGEKPPAEIVKNLKPSSREIITNEVHNIGGTFERITKKYYDAGLYAILRQQSGFLPEMESFVLKTLDNLEQMIEQEKPSEYNKAFLRVLNDFSFHAQKQIHKIKEQHLPENSQILSNATEVYLDELRAVINVMPERIRIKLPSKGFAIKSHDNFRTRSYKIRKMILATLARGPVTHRIRITPAARYFLYHRRLESMRNIMNDFALHTFEEVVELRKTFTDIHELIEKSRLTIADRSKVFERISLERSRLKAKIEVLKSESQAFFYQTGETLFSSLLEDLQQFSHHLESTGANLGSSNFSVYFKNDPKLVEELSGFSTLWGKNLSLFINKGLLDFIILSLKSRIFTKIDKYFLDFSLELNASLQKQVQAYKAFAANRELSDKSIIKADGKLDHSKLQRPQAVDLFRGLYDEIRELLDELPEKLEISGNLFAEKIGKEAYPEVETIVVDFRKTVNYYLSAELFDYTRNHLQQTEREFEKIIINLKDLVRLVNFSLDNETLAEEEEKGELKDQAHSLLQNFQLKLKEEELRIANLQQEVSNAFERGMHGAFEPLSSATISKTSQGVRKKLRESESQKASDRFREKWERSKSGMQQHFVNLIYRKSEGKLWFSHFERPDPTPQLSNRRTLSFVQSITPGPEVIKELPFYYYSLFSGQSGTSEDFWVGMSSELREAEQAVKRFKAGYTGAMIITGERSSGKSSLSKLVSIKNFSPGNVHSVRAPKGCTADPNLFASSLLKALKASNRNLDDVFRALPSGKIIIINDLELWWERKPGGTKVIQLLKDLIDRFGNKCLFVLNCNIHALNVIDRSSRLKSYSLGTIVCHPFDARELKEIIMLRHHSGGLKFVMNRKEDERFSAWDYASLFNRFFELSHGNPGSAILLWLASVEKFSGKTLVMKTPDPPSPEEVFKHLEQEQLFYLLQFVLHRRWTLPKLAENLLLPLSEVYSDIREMVRAGILIEQFEGIYAIHPGLDPHLVEKLKSVKLL